MCPIRALVSMLDYRQASPDAPLFLLPASPQGLTLTPGLGSTSSKCHKFGSYLESLICMISGEGGPPGPLQEEFPLSRSRFKVPGPPPVCGGTSHFLPLPLPRWLLPSNTILLFSLLLLGVWGLVLPSNISFLLSLQCYVIWWASYL